MKKAQYKDDAKKKCTFCTQSESEAAEWRDRQIQFYGSIAWQNLREAVKKERGGLCERCRKKGIYKAGIVVHHIRELDAANINDPAIALNPENLMLLCVECHAEIHQKHPRRYVIGEDGKVICK